MQSSTRKSTISSHLKKIKDFGPILRIALTGSSSSAGGVFEVCEIIGKSEAQKRINNLL